MRLENYKIIVTGGAGGIGGATVRAYVKEGAQVAVIDIDDERGKMIVDEANKLAQGPGQAYYYHCDVANKADVDAIFDDIAEKFGGLDVLAHLAAKDTDHMAPDEYVDEELIQRFWEVNINGTIWTNQAAYRHFKKAKKGAIINYASDTGRVGSATQAIYASSKGANLAWTRTIADVWARESNVRANAICPHIMSPMYQAFIDGMDPEAREAFKEGYMKKAYPMFGWPGDPDRDAGPFMVYMASDESVWVNGQTIGLNGGANMTF